MCALSMAFLWYAWGCGLYSPLPGAGWARRLCVRGLARPVRGGLAAESWVDSVVGGVDWWLIGFVCLWSMAFLWWVRVCGFSLRWSALLGAGWLLCVCGLGPAVAGSG